MAQAVVDELEAVQVEQQHRHQPPRTAGVMERLGQPVMQQGPVGQAGQFVVGGQVFQLLFVALALADIDVQAEQLGRAFRFPYDGMAGKDRHRRSVLAHQCQFRGRDGLARLRHPAQGVFLLLAHPGRNDQLQQVPSDRLFGAVAIEPLGSRVPVVHRAVHAVALECHGWNLLQDAAEAGLALPQGSFGLLVLAQQPPFPQCPLHDLGHAGKGRGRFDDVIQGTGFHGGDGHLLVAVGGHDQQGKVPVLGRRGQQLRCATVGQVHVDQDDVGRVGCHDPAALPQRSCNPDPHRRIRRSQGAGNRLGMGRLILDDKYVQLFLAHQPLPGAESDA